MIYEFWDMRSNNILNAFDSKDEAIKAIRDAVQSHGEMVVEFLMLVEDDPSADAKKLIGIGSELLSYIRDAA
jgi:hypothetical protein